MDTARESYKRLRETHYATLKELKDAKAEISRLRAPKPMTGGLRSPKLRGTKSHVVAAGIWTVLVKTKWLSGIALAANLPSGFFLDPDVAGYCTIGISWVVREIRELV